MRTFFILASALVAAACATSERVADASLEGCLTLSFAPLDDNVPACTALIARADALDRDTLAAVHAARAAAYEFALTYDDGHEVEAGALLQAALADLDQAVALSSRWHARRGDILFQLSRFVDAAESYTLALAAEPAAAASLLESRSFARAEAGDLAGAIGDISEAIDRSASAIEARRRTLRRGELREAAGDVAGALADYREVVAGQPDNVTAREAVERLERGG
jgi:tetratricopeptide (TPR) repeat protein